MGWRRKMREKGQEDGFEKWGGYMAAKVAKLDDQFKEATVQVKISDIFNGVAIMVNGITRPSSEELRKLMAQHGGVFHMYPSSTTTHIIASNLANVKIKNLGTKPVVKPSWITDSLDMGRLLDFKRYLLYTNQSVTQPKLEFPVIQKPVGDVTTTVLPSSSDSNEDSTSKMVEINENTSTVQNRITKTAADPNFLEEFYNNSRLHLISTLGAEFKQLVGQLREKSDGIFSGRNKLINESTRCNRIILSNKVIMHIDMDCFFVSVGLRNHPELRGKPVAITHARNAQTSSDRSASREVEFALYKGTCPEGSKSRVDYIDGNSSMSEIASCSYEARKCGVKNGMFLGSAIKLCPNLKTLPYDFEGYKEVSNTLYRTIASYTLDIEAVSCDEMYVDCTQILKESGLTVLEWATHIRNEIMTVTGCPCSTGFGANRLQARLATRKAKPAGQYYLEADDVELYMSDIPLADLPGVGRATLAKLNHLGLNTCGDVQIASLRILQQELGIKAGETLMDQARGIDKKPLNYNHERKSVSAEINYGIRFKTIEECYNFLQSLSNEVYNRLVDTGMRARCLTLKLLVRAENAPVETAKFLGHGVCDSLNKSTISNIVINDPQTIFKEAKNLYEKLNPPFVDLRGVGIQLSKLEKLSNMNTAMTKFLNQAQKFQKQEKSISNLEKTKCEEKPIDEIKEGTVVDNKINTSVAKTSCNTIKEPVVKSNPVSTSTVKASVRGGIVKRGRGRGRGRGSKTSNRTVNNAKSLSNFFIEKKKLNNSEPIKKQNIDLNVLRELPESIRNEIIKEYELVDADVNNDIIENQRTENVEGKKVIAENSKKSSNESPFSKLSWDEIKPIIKHWIQSEEDPSECDAEMLGNHFKQLATDRKIDNFTSIFNFLHRIMSHLSCSWHKMYFIIVDITQQGMVARYGATLLVKREFDCCTM